MDITIYTITGCTYCSKIKELMSRANISDYKEIKVGQQLSRSEFKDKYPQATGFPFAVINDQPIGGLVDTVKYFVENGLVSSRK